MGKPQRVITKAFKQEAGHPSDPVPSAGGGAKWILCLEEAPAELALTGR